MNNNDFNVNNQLNNNTTNEFVNNSTPVQEVPLTTVPEVQEIVTPEVNQVVAPVEDISKAQKTLRNDFFLLFAIEVISIVYVLTSKEPNLNILTIVYTLLTLLGIFLTTCYPKYSWIVGMIIGLAMILSILDRDIIDAILGLFVVIHSFICLIENFKKKKA